MLGDLGDLGVIGYIGSKRRYAGAILDAMQRRFGPPATWPAFADLCCGTASVAIEVLRRAPQLQVTVVDAGAWGAFWAAFQADRQAVLQAITSLYRRRGADSVRICHALAGRRLPRAEPAAAAQFLAAQRATYMSREPAVRSGRWQPSCQALRYGRAHGPGLLLRRLAAVPRFEAIHGRAEDYRARRGEVVYIDPPYAGTSSGYTHAIDVPATVDHALRAGARVALSHHQPYPGVQGPTVTINRARCLRNRCRREILVFPTRATAPDSRRA